MLSEEISQKLLRSPQVALFPTPVLCYWRTATRDYGTLLVNIIQMFHMVVSSALPCMALYIQVNCDRILDRQKYYLYYC